MLDASDLQMKRTMEKSKEIQTLLKTNQAIVSEQLKNMKREENEVEKVLNLSSQAKYL